jgi:predicted porin
MNKIVVSCLLLACAGVANAQSTATVSGTISAGYLKAIDGSKGLVLDANSIRVSLTEDLGDGLKLSAFTQFKGNSVRGGNVQKEDSAITLSSTWGTLAFQNTRTNTLARDVGLVADNWVWDGPYSSNNKEVFSREAADVLTYTTPDMSGLKASVAYFENATDGSATASTQSASLALVYAAGPLRVAGRYINSKNDSWTGTTNKNSFDLGASYDLGVAKIGLGYDSKRRGKTSSDKAAVTASVSAPVGPVTFGLNYGKRDASDFTEASVKYALSKRSAVYLDYGKAKMAKNASNSQYNLILVHTF